MYQSICCPKDLGSDGFQNPPGNRFVLRLSFHVFSRFLDSREPPSSQEWLWSSDPNNLPLELDAGQYPLQLDLSFRVWPSSYIFYIFVLAFFHGFLNIEGLPPDIFLHVQAGISYNPLSRRPGRTVAQTPMDRQSDTHSHTQTVPHAHTHTQPHGRVGTQTHRHAQTHGHAVTHKHSNNSKPET